MEALNAGARMSWGINRRGKVQVRSEGGLGAVRWDNINCYSASVFLDIKRAILHNIVSRIYSFERKIKLRAKERFFPGHSARARKRHGVLA